MSLQSLKDAGGMAFGALIVILFLALPIVFLLGAAEFSVWALEWIPGTIGIAILVSLAILPLTFIAKARSWAALLYGIASLVFLACLWLYSLAFTYLEWGMMAVVIGVLMAGVGVIFTGTLAALFSATWVVLGNIAFLFGLFIVTRFLSGWLEHSAENYALEERARENPSTVTLTQNSEI